MFYCFEGKIGVVAQGQSVCFAYRRSGVWFPPTPLIVLYCFILLLSDMPVLAAAAISAPFSVQHPVPPAYPPIPLLCLTAYLFGPASLSFASSPVGLPGYLCDAFAHCQLSIGIMFDIWLSFEKMVLSLKCIWVFLFGLEEEILYAEFAICVLALEFALGWGFVECTLPLLLCSCAWSSPHLDNPIR